MSKQRIDLGKKGEELAISYLKGQGYKILERNYQCRWGEIDIIAKEKKTLSFVEVKSRTSSLFGPPETSVTSRKQHQISKVALNYLKEHRLEEVEARFDVVSIQFLPQGEKIELIKNAFDLKIG